MKRRARGSSPLQMCWLIDLGTRRPLPQISPGSIDLLFGSSLAGCPLVDEHRGNHIPALGFQYIARPTRVTIDKKDRIAACTSGQVVQGQSAFPQIPVDMDEETHGDDANSKGWAQRAIGPGTR